jgi:hypothetical protein
VSWGARKSDRVTFANGHAVHIMGIDGTWRRKCILLDVSTTGARLTVEGSIEGLKLKEFFLLLSSTGLALMKSVSNSLKITPAGREARDPSGTSDSSTSERFNFEVQLCTLLFRE